MNELEENEKKLRKINQKLDEETNKAILCMKSSTLPSTKLQKNENWSNNKEEKLSKKPTINEIKAKISNSENVTNKEVTPSLTKTSKINTNTFTRKQNHEPFSLTKKKPVKTIATSNSTNNLNSDTNIKFLKSKISILQDELENRSIAMTKKIEEFELCLEQQKKIENERNQINMKNNSLCEQIKKLEDKLSINELKLKERDKEYLNQNRELENLKREMKLLNQVNCNLEKRLNKLNEENEKIKLNLNVQKNNENDFKENFRKEKDMYEKQLQKLKTQKQELFTAYKKQLYYIDNLKRQIVCLEQARMIALAANEFSQVLEWNTKN